MNIFGPQKSFTIACLYIFVHTHLPHVYVYVSEHLKLWTLLAVNTYLYDVADLREDRQFHLDYPGAYTISTEQVGVQLSLCLTFQRAEACILLLLFICLHKESNHDLS